MNQTHEKYKLYVSENIAHTDVISDQGQVSV